MKINIFLVLFVTLTASLGAQISENLILGTNWQDESLPTSSSVRYNDIWGYTDCSGNEYAILGSARFTHFINVTDPNNLVQVEQFEGTVNSIWRDFKTYKTFAYGVADQGNEGLSVFDLTNLPNSVAQVSMDNTVFGRAHNIYIDEANGKLYVAGANQGLIVYDLTANPAVPALIGVIDLTAGGGYVHDVFVRNNIAYCSHGWAGYYVWDFNDPLNPVILASVETNGYNHSSWVSDNNQYAFIAEEVPAGLPMLVVDLSDMLNGNISVVKDFKEPLLAPDFVNNTPHNPFVRGNHLIVSYYEDGVQVFDISNPVEPTRIAYYDTQPDNDQYNGTRNNWGTYPYLPSGTILASDTRNGLFVLTPTYPNVAPITTDLTPSLAWNSTDDILTCEETLPLNLNGTANSIVWSYNDEIAADLTGTAVEINASGNYSVVASNGKCRLLLDTLSVSFEQTPAVDFSTMTSNILLCEGETSLLEIPAGATSYEWFQNGISTGQTTNAITVNASGIYTVTAYSQNCSATSIEMEVLVNAYPDVSWNQNTSISICEDETYFLEAPIGAQNYTWFQNGEILPNQTASFVEINTAGTYYVEASNGACMATSETVVVEIKLNPDATIAGPSLLEICSTESTTLSTTTGADSYMWTLNGNPIPNETTNTLAVLEAGIYQVSVLQNGCSNTSQTVEVIVTDYPSVLLNTTADIALCDAETFTLQIPFGANAYQWFLDGNPIENQTTNTLTVNETGNYAVQASNSICQANSQTVSVTNNLAPDATIAGPSLLEICSTESTTLSTTTGADSYMWTLNGNPIPNETTNTLAVLEAGTYQVSVLQNGCSNTSQTVEVIVTDYPSVLLNTTADIALCDAETFTLEIPFGANAYQWFLDGNPIENQTTNTLTGNEAGSYLVEATNGICSVQSVSISVTSEQSPIITISNLEGENFEICKGESITLVASGSSTYFWSTGSTEASTTVSPEIMTTYTVVSGPEACSGGATAIVLVNETPMPTITGETTICANETTTLAAAQTADSYTWTLDGNPIPDANNPTLIASEAGTYQVTSTLNGCAGTSEPHLLEVSPLPNASVLSEVNVTICEGESTVIELNKGADAYTWTLDGTLIETATAASLMVNSAGTYQAQISTNGCTAITDLVAVNLVEAPNATLSQSGEAIICAGDTLKVDVPMGDNTYTWFVNEQILETESNNSIVISETGTYQVEVANASCSRFSETLFVNVLPAPEMIELEPFSACDANEVTLSLSVNEDLLYEWALNDIVIEAAASQLTVSESGTYTATVYEAQCPIEIYTTAVNLGFSPSGSISADALTFCVGDSVYINSAEDAETYNWYQDDNLLNETGSALLVTAPGVYQLIAANGICETSSEPIQLFHFTPSVPTITSDGNLLSTQAATSYQWYLDGVLIAGANMNTLAIEESGLYSVAIVDFNACSAESEDFLATYTAISEVLTSVKMQLYPNPVVAELLIQLHSDTPQDGFISITNTVGQLIYTQRISLESNLQRIISVQDWTKGLYLVRIQTKEGILVRKFVKA